MKRRIPRVYTNGNYKVMITPNGTKRRKTDDDEFIPSFAENCDVKITDKCNQRCPFCYEKCNPTGKHADLKKYKTLINSLHPHTEMALNGNDMDHPDLEWFLKELLVKEVIADVTVNQNQFIQNIDKLRELTKNRLIKGVGISLKSINQDFLNLLKEFPNAVIHTIAGILDEDTIMSMKDKGLKVLILGYKNIGFGRGYLGSNEDKIKNNMNTLSKLLPDIINEKWFDILSFDNLALTQLPIVKETVSEKEWEEEYMGDDGEFTFYIDLVKGQFSKNSVSQVRKDCNDLTVDEMFKAVKDICKSKADKFIIEGEDEVFNYGKFTVIDENGIEQSVSVPPTDRVSESKNTKVNPMLFESEKDAEVYLQTFLSELKADKDITYFIKEYGNSVTYKINNNE